LGRIVVACTSKVLLCPADLRLQQSERSRLVREGPRWTRDRKGDFKRVTLPERDCDLLRDFLVAEKVETIVEIGSAYGNSALAIGEALVSAHQSRPLHVIIDPLRETTWANVGWELIQTAGLEPLSQLILQPSSQALPRLVEQGFMADAALWMEVIDSTRCSLIYTFSARSSDRRNCRS
jgi:hypothetical protein